MKALSDLERGAPEAALAALDAAIQRLERDPAASTELAQAYLLLGIANATLDKELTARWAFKEALLRDRNVRLDQTKWPKAVEVFGAALDEVTLDQERSGPVTDIETLTNTSIARLVAARLGDAIIVAAIEDAPRRNFDLSVAGLISLKEAGVSEAVIAAMQKTRAPKRSPDSPDSRTEAVETSRLGGSRGLPTEPRDAPCNTLDAYRIDPTTGDLTALESMNKKTPTFGPRMVYIDGASSPVTFEYGERHAFATCLVNTTLDAQRSQSPSWRLELLAVKNGKRYATKLYVPLEIGTYGHPRYGLVARRPEWASQSFRFTPRAVLQPGQYALSRGGMFDGMSYGAFAIVER